MSHVGAAGHRDGPLAHEVVNGHLCGALPFVPDSPYEFKKLHHGGLLLAEPLRPLTGQPAVERRVSHESHARAPAEVQHAFLWLPVKDAVSDLVARNGNLKRCSNLHRLLKLCCVVVAHTNSGDLPPLDSLTHPFHERLRLPLDGELHLPEVHLFQSKAVQAGLQRCRHGGLPGADIAPQKPVCPWEWGVLGADDDRRPGGVCPYALEAPQQLLCLLPFCEALVPIDFISIEECAALSYGCLKQQRQLLLVVGGAVAGLGVTPAPGTYPHGRHLQT
mmetsp:Transcript_38443/g.108639  ORF Transcript_38443/g.108639 Transcript_38443/m.108639 type:complete len:276 (-) Transcript_38443:558-1385(-)